MTNESNAEGAIPPNYQLELATQRKELQRLSGMLQAARAEPEDEDVIDLREIWNLLVRRRWTIVTTLVVAMIVALLYSFLATPIYRATLLLQIEREDNKVVEYQSVTPSEAMDSSQDFYQTQYELLQSRSLARRIIDQLGLESSPSFVGEKKDSFLSGLAQTATGWMSSDTAPVEEKAPDLETLFLSNLTVAPLKNSRLVRVNYDSPDPQEAAEIANAVASNFVNTSLERRFEATSYAKTFLAEQIQQIRANLEDSERRLLTYAREREIVNLDDRVAIYLKKLNEMSSELIKAEAERIKAEAEYQGLLDNGAFNTGAVIDSPLIQKLKERKAELETRYQEQLKLFKPGYPSMQELQRQIAEASQQIHTESAAIAGSVKSIFEAKVRQEAKLTQRTSEIKQEILDLQDRSTDYQTLKREVDTNRELYDGLLQRMKEVGVVAGIGSNNIAVVDVAETPQKKYKPSTKLNLAIAIALGLFGGALLAFLFETLDDTIKTSADVEKRIGAPVLGIIPYIQPQTQKSAANDIALLAHKDPKSPLSEAFRSLRTSLVFSTAEGAPKIIHITSSSPGEGKTTVATSTAITFAQTGSKVLLIDGDLRNPSVHKIFTLPNSSGLTNYLAGNTKAAEIAQPTQVKGLFVMTSGPLPPNPVELLSSAKMLDLVRITAERFDYVIIDSPPIIGLADALVLASLARATIFTVDAGVTRIGALDGSIKRLRDANVNLLGAVLTKFGKAGTGYGYGYGYGYSYDYHYTYNYGAKDNPAVQLPLETAS
ncbi:polysaccharide biosynthesis tyrosine autokinase [uncultured Thiocystis sp.]|jgi:capsular exopolysaccharide synthesis family protein|uniref:GumC family protein n=1 Tax=uncultured Thiocystis sp. TaxID=1202134 RepID=UPI0026004E6C|nr:polysaccharide biosynthesis tyrosine autokinase [uncultured Thiocystis sp.]